MQRADEQHETDTTFLADIAFPPVDEIAADPEFSAEEISIHEFEDVWLQAGT